MKKQAIIQHGRDHKINSQDIETIILYNTGLSKNQYFLVDEIDNFESILEDFRRMSEGFPIQYITHLSEFYGREFYVDSYVLIPRIDTELMVDLVLKNAQGKSPHIIDVGVGSAIIPITLCHELEVFKSIKGFDISEKALKVAQRNIDTHKFKNTINVFHSHLLDECNVNEYKKDETVIITANLPYIKNDDHHNMSDSTVLYEPTLALYGGQGTGFELYEELIIQCKKMFAGFTYLELFIEIGFDQGKVARDFLELCELDFEIYDDSATIERVIQIRF